MGWHAIKISQSYNFLCLERSSKKLLHPLTVLTGLLNKMKHNSYDYFSFYWNIFPYKIDLMYVQRKRFYIHLFLSRFPSHMYSSLSYFCCLLFFLSNSAIQQISLVDLPLIRSIWTERQPQQQQQRKIFKMLKRKETTLSIMQNIFINFM